MSDDYDFVEEEKKKLKEGLDEGYDVLGGRSDGGALEDAEEGRENNSKAIVLLLELLKQKGVITENELITLLYEAV